jgi:hypothetical protein
LSILRNLSFPVDEFLGWLGFATGPNMRQNVSGAHIGRSIGAFYLARIAVVKSLNAPFNMRQRFSDFMTSTPDIFA